MTDADSRYSSRGIIRIIAVFIAAWVIINISFRFAEWRSSEVLLPGYCDKTEEHLSVLKKIISESRPVKDKALSPYIKAARLLYLVPRQGAEPVNVYLGRVREIIRQSCP